MRDLRAHHRADRHEIQLARGVVHGQLPTLHGVLRVAVELAQQRAQRVSTVERGAGLAVAGEDPVAGSQRPKRPYQRGLFAPGGQIEADAALALESHKLLVEQAIVHHGLIEMAQLIGRDGRLPLGTHHAARIVENPDKLELHQACLTVASRVVKARGGHDTAWRGGESYPCSFT